jgi:hypothetical protein
MLINKANKNRAFTLIELNLVVILMAVIGLTVYASFSAGARIWQRSKANTPEINAHIFLDKISSDLRNCLKFSAILPKGNVNELSFAIFKRSDAKDKDFVGFGKVVYSFDYNKESVSRSYQDFTQILRNRADESPRVVLDNIKSCSFKYYYFNIDSSDSGWKSSMDTVFPSAVKIDISFTLDNKTSVISKIVSLYPGN